MNFVVNISSDRRTVIPKNVANEIGLKPGKYNVQYEEGKIIIDLNSPFDENIVSDNILQKEQNNTVIKDSKTSHITNNIKIESNLKEAENYSRKVYSECGLVVRTKRKYLTKFCDVCQGTLLVDYPDVHQDKCIFFKQEQPKQKDDYVEFNETPIEEKVKDKDHYVEYKDDKTNTQNKSDNKQFRTNKNVMSISDYINKFITKTKTQPTISETNKEMQKSNKDNVVKNLTENINKLDKQLDKKIIEIDKKHQSKDVDIVKDEILDDYANKTIYFKPIKKYTHCSQCGELYNKGFYLDDSFICRSCLQQDFMKYFNKVRRSV